MMGRMVLVSRPSMRLPSFEDELAHDVSLALLELLFDELLVLGPLLGAELGEQRLDELLLERRVAVVARLLVGDAGRVAEIAVDEGGHARLHVGGERLGG